MEPVIIPSIRVSGTRYGLISPRFNFVRSIRISCVLPISDGTVDTRISCWPLYKRMPSAETSLFDNTNSPPLSITHGLPLRSNEDSLKRIFAPDGRVCTWAAKLAELIVCVPLVFSVTSEMSLADLTVIWVPGNCMLSLTARFRISVSTERLSFVPTALISKPVIPILP